MGKSLVSYFLTHGVNTLGYDADIITLYRWRTVVSQTSKYDGPEVENVARGRLSYDQLWAASLIGRNAVQHSKPSTADTFGIW